MRPGHAILIGTWWAGKFLTFPCIFFCLGAGQISSKIFENVRKGVTARPENDDFSVFSPRLEKAQSEEAFRSPPRPTLRSRALEVIDN
jgi:hypothetical protein